MPTFSSWKNRLLGRKTPEPERAVHVTLPKEPEVSRMPDVAGNRRGVRFDESRNQFAPQDAYIEPDWQNEYGEARVIGEVNPGGRPIADQRAGEWQYADDVRVSIAPLAASELDDEPPRSRFAPPPVSRGSSVLQNLREQKDQLDYSERRRQAATLPAGSSAPQGPMGYRPMSPATRPPIQQFRTPEPPFRSRDPYPSRSEESSYARPHDTFSLPPRTDSRQAFDDMMVVFLQANDEVKRTILPPEVTSFEQVKMAFVRAFPNLSRHYIDQPNVKIYIQEPSKGQLFYELDDPRDIKNKSVLKLREQMSNGMQSPTPRWIDHTDYHSEIEQDDRRDRFISLARPASALAQADYGPPKPRPKAFDPYDPYSSDASSHDSRSVTRSGSATPIIDRESRARMETMERQLAGLSSLVHSALVSKGMSESTHKDMADLRREILAMHPDAEREASEEPPSLPDSLSSHAQHQLGSLRHKVQQTNTEMRQLRRTAQVNAQAARGLLKEAGDQIAHIIAERVGGDGGHRHVENKEENEEDKRAQAERLTRLLDDLTGLEHNVESVRNSVLTSNRKLRMSEVESLTESLTQIGRAAAGLKTDFQPVHSAMEARIKADMEKIVRDEKFIRDQTTAVDQSLRRCKALANIMVTMKKLAMVQDPSIHRTKKDTPSTKKASTEAPVLSIPPPPQAPPPSSHVVHPPTPMQSTHYPPPPIMNGGTLHAPIDPEITEVDPGAEIPAAYIPNVPRNTIPQLPDIPPVPPSPSNYQSPAASLDGVLEEISSPGQPPRPPSRFSVQDVRTKFTKPPELPEQIRSLIEDVARRASPAPERHDQVAERRQDLEERQERLAEKQRQLRNQFQQLQQLTPLPQ